jgi:hypothetical protein
MCVFDALIECAKIHCRIRCCRMPFHEYDVKNITKTTFICFNVSIGLLSPALLVRQVIEVVRVREETEKRIQTLRRQEKQHVTSTRGT